MKVIILASGSKGNATYIETNNTKIRIDAGISYNKLKERLFKFDILLDKLDAILVTHEHIDHVMHLAQIKKRTNAKVYINEQSYYNLPKTVTANLTDYNVFFINPESKYQINDLHFVPISLFHDTKSIYGYLFRNINTNVAYITDTGHLLPKFYPILRKMNVLILESNHDVEMLLNSKRDYRLKQRILSNNGHLSNEQCENILYEVISENTKHLVLAHLSEECNTEELAIKHATQAITKCKASTNLLVGKQNEPIFIELEDDCA
jgi:phosphoribosyl 1,2-cyclic phosphodiesterase